MIRTKKFLKRLIITSIVVGAGAKLYLKKAEADVVAEALSAVK